MQTYIWIQITYNSILVNEKDVFLFILSLCLLNKVIRIHSCEGYWFVVSNLIYLYKSILLYVRIADDENHRTKFKVVLKTRTATIMGKGLLLQTTIYVTRKFNCHYSSHNKMEIECVVLSAVHFWWYANFQTTTGVGWKSTVWGYQFSTKLDILVHSYIMYIHILRCYNK